MSGSYDNTLKVWDVETGEWECLEGHSDDVRCAVSTDFRDDVSSS